MTARTTGLDPREERVLVASADLAVLFNYRIEPNGERIKWKANCCCCSRLLASRLAEYLSRSLRWARISSPVLAFEYCFSAYSLFLVCVYVCVLQYASSVFLFGRLRHIGRWQSSTPTLGHTVKAAKTECDTHTHNVA